MTVRPALASRWPSSVAAMYNGSSGWLRADPKIVTAGPSGQARRILSTNSPHDAKDAPRVGVGEGRRLARAWGLHSRWLIGVLASHLAGLGIWNAVVFRSSHQ